MSAVNALGESMNSEDWLPLLLLDGKVDCEAPRKL